MQPQTDLQGFDKLKAEITLFVKPISEIKVKDKDSMDHALAVGGNIKAMQKRIEDRRTEMVKPLNERVKAINTYAKEIAGPLDQSETLVKNQLRAHEIVLDKQRREEQAKLEAAQRKAEQEAAEKARQQQEQQETAAMFMEEPEAKMAEATAQAETSRVEKEIKTDFKSKAAAVASNKVAGAKKVWKFEITDATLVPRQYLIVDEKLIRQAVSVGLREIAGVRIYEDVQIALGSR